MSKVSSLQPALHRTQLALNGLPPGAVILDRHGHAWQQGGQYRFAGPEHSYWYRSFGDDSSVTSWELAQLGPIKVMAVKE